MLRDVVARMEGKARRIHRKMQYLKWLELLKLVCVLLLSLACALRH